MLDGYTNGRSIEDLIDTGFKGSGVQDLLGERVEEGSGDLDRLGRAADHGEQRAAGRALLPAADAGVEQVHALRLGGGGQGVDRVEGDGGVHRDHRARGEGGQHAVGGLGR